jgi:hypothetical protein
MKADFIKTTATIEGCSHIQGKTGIGAKMASKDPPVPPKNENKNGLTMDLQIDEAGLK